MSALEQRILATLSERMPELIARSLVRRCAAALGVSPPDLEVSHLPELARQLEPGIRLFVAPADQQTLLDRVCTLKPTPELEALTVSITSEADITRVRSISRTAATELGAGPFATQKIVTVVSELARNIVLYAGSGHVELVPSTTPRPKLKIVATDRGPGITDVDRVLSGNYKSKTGLGRGLLSVRRIAENFRIDTSSRGTVVQAEFVL